MFGIAHLSVIFGLILLNIAVAFILIKYVKKERYVMIIKIGACIQLVLWVISRIIYMYFDPDFVTIIPDSLCSTIGLIMPIFILCLKRESKAMFFVMMAGFFGGNLTIIFGDGIGVDAIIVTAISWTYHGFMGIVALSAIVTRFFTVRVSKFNGYLLGLCCCVAYGVFTNQVLGTTNNMYLNAPLIENTFLTWYFTGMLILTAVFLFSWALEMIMLPKKERTFNIIHEKFKTYKMKKEAN